MSAAPERQHYSVEETIRAALRAWATGLMEEIAPATVVMGEMLEPGEAPELATLGIAWGATEEVDTRPVDEEVFEDGRGVWRLHYEETALAFIWRGTSAEDADYWAHEFKKRATLACVRSNTSGDRVLHMAIEADGLARTAKLYLEGRVAPERSDDNLLRSLYAFRVPATVVYPVMAIEDAAGRQGRMNIVIEINGHRTALADVIAAS